LEQVEKKEFLGGTGQERQKGRHDRTHVHNGTRGRAKGEKRLQGTNGGMRKHAHRSSHQKINENAELQIRRLPVEQGIKETKKKQEGGGKERIHTLKRGGAQRQKRGS